MNISSKRLYPNTLSVLNKYLIKVNKKKKGCNKYQCISLSIIFILSIALIFFAIIINYYIFIGLVFLFIFTCCLFGD